ncbi:MAG: PilZ domain-containing protein [Phycisphaerae bacterium]
MDADRIVKMTPQVVADLLDSRRVEAHPKTAPGLRQSERWPFAGTVEVWLPASCYGERHVLATMHNLSRHGLAMRARRPIPTDTKISIAIHEPELSCYGDAYVRHCTTAAAGYLIGCEFVYPQDDEATPGS